MTTITIWSESGGVGKTTTALNLAAALGNAGKRVLLVDLDPQPGSLTDHAGYPEAKTVAEDADEDEVTTIVDVLLDSASLTDIRIDGERYDIVPGHESLASLESTVRSQQMSTAEFLLDSALADVEDEYDFILIDPPATLNLIVDNALIASDSVLIPMEMTRKGERSISGVVETVTALESQLQRAKPDFELNIIGVLPNRMEGSLLNQEIEASLDDADWEKDVEVLDIAVPDYNVMEQAWDERMDIFEYADEYGLRVYQESILDAYTDLAALLTTDETDELEDDVVEIEFQDSELEAEQ